MMRSLGLITFVTLAVVTGIESYNFQVPVEVIANEPSTYNSNIEVFDTLINGEHTYFAHLVYDSISDNFVSVNVTIKKYSLDRPHNAQFLSQTTCAFGYLYGSISSGIFLLKNGNAVFVNSLPSDDTCQVQVFDMTSCTMNNALNLLSRSSCKAEDLSSFVLYENTFDLFVKSNLPDCGLEFCLTKYSFDYDGNQIGKYVPFLNLPYQLSSKHVHNDVYSVTTDSSQAGYWAMDTSVETGLDVYLTNSKGSIIKTSHFSYPHFDFVKDGKIVTILYKSNQYIHTLLQNDKRLKFKAVAELAIPPKYKILSFYGTKDGENILVWTFDTSLARHSYLEKFKIHAIKKNGNIVNTFEFFKQGETMPIIDTYNSSAIKGFSIYETTKKFCFEFCPKHSMSKYAEWPKFVLTCINKDIIVASAEKEKIKYKIQSRIQEMEEFRAKSLHKIIGTRNFFNNFIRTLNSNHK